MVQASVPLNDADRSETAWSRGGTVSCRDLMVSFTRIGLLGFGGVAPVARHELLERRGWLDDREYAALLGLGKVLPGANTVNAAVMIGDRFHGPKGALLSVCALMAAPLVIVVILALIYQHFASNPLVHGAIGGAAAAAAGLVLGVAAKMARGLRPTVVAAVIAIVTLVGVGLLKAPLLLWILLFGPIAIAMTRLWGSAAVSDDENLLWPLAKTFALVSMLAIGGANAVVPEIHRQVVLNAHWMDEATFAQLFAISQAAPGPNVLIVSVVGWQVAGVLGLMVATLAMLTPSSLLAFVVGRFVGRVSGSPWYRLAEDALVPVSVGLIAASGLIMADAAVTHWLLGLVTAGSAAFVFFTNRNPIWAILAGMIAGVVLAL